MFKASDIAASGYIKLYVHFIIHNPSSVYLYLRLPSTLDRTLNTNYPVLSITWVSLLLNTILRKMKLIMLGILDLKYKICQLQWIIPRNQVFSNNRTRVSVRKSQSLWVSDKKPGLKKVMLSLCWNQHNRIPFYFFSAIGIRNVHTFHFIKPYRYKVYRYTGSRLGFMKLAIP